MADQDLGLHYRLSIVKRDGDLVLVGTSNNDRNAPPIEVGRTNGIHQGFSKIVLEPGWQFTKRTFDDKTLGNAFAPDSETHRSYAAAATVRMLNCVKEES